MAFDFAHSDDPVLDRLLVAAGRQRMVGVDLSLVRIERLLQRMASPHLALPPVFHVAGTNGKGSVVAFLRAALEAAGHRVHVFTSPHLVRVNERIRVAGHLVTNEDLSEALAEVLRFNAGQPLTFFETLTAAAFLLFAANPADATILEVGLGGRLDSTNVIPHPAVTGIAQIAIDHQKILGPTLRHIAAEKAGIAKRDVPLVTQKYPRAVAAAVREVALVKGARLRMRGESWDAALEESADRFAFHMDGAEEPIELPRPKLAGAHQIDNAALAVAMLRAQDALAVPDSALRSAMGWADWPARLQRIRDGALFALLPKGSEMWIDGGHNPAAARAITHWIGAAGEGAPWTIVAGILDTKDHRTYFRSLPRGADLVAIPVPEHQHVAPEKIAEVAAAAGLAARTAGGIAAALRSVKAPGRVLLTGSIHLCGAFLKENGPLPR